MANNVTTFSKLGQVRSFSKLIETMCKNPRMYTMKGTFEEAAAWLQGFAAGLSEAELDLASEWYGFTIWLPQRLSYSEDLVWCSALKRAYQKDEAAFEQLLSLYNEYRANTGSIRK